jgi:O-antigen/teichoic acid export membrane protein
MSLFSQIQRLYASEFFKFSAVLLSSSVIAQIIGFAVYPVITRLYNPDIFGEFNLFLSIVGVAALLTTGGYASAIILPKSEKKSSALFHLSLSFTLAISLIALLVVLLFGDSIASLFGQESLAKLLPYLPVYLLSLGLWRILNNYFMRQKMYYNISVYTITQTAVGSSMKCLLGLQSLLSFGLVWGQLSGQLLALVVSAISGRKSFKQLKRWDKKEMIAVAKAYSNFPKFQLPQSLLNTFADNLPILLLSFYFTMDKIGILSLALIVGLTPVILLANSVYQVLYGRISKLVQDKGSIMRDFLLFIKMYLLLVLPLFVLFVFVPDSFFGWLFGAKWAAVGFYLKLMLPWLFLELINITMFFVPHLFFKQKTSLLLEIIYVIARITALLVGGYLHNFALAVVFFVCVSTLMLTVKLIWYYRLIKKYESSLIYDNNKINQQ